MHGPLSVRYYLQYITTKEEPAEFPMEEDDLIQWNTAVNVTIKRPTVLRVTHSVCRAARYDGN